MLGNTQDHFPPAIQTGRDVRIVVRRGRRGAAELRQILEHYLRHSIVRREHEPIGNYATVQKLARTFDDVTWHWPPASSVLPRSPSRGRHRPSAVPPEPCYVLRGLPAPVRENSASVSARLECP